jgi:hypothetical protein
MDDKFSSISKSDKVLTPVTMKPTIAWDVVPCSLVADVSEERTLPVFRVEE